MSIDDILATSLSLHSHKGGSGKTLVAMNLAAYLVQKGKRVALIDMDLTAPSLGTFVTDHEGKTLNDFLLKRATAEEVFFDATNLIGDDAPGKLFMGLADMAGEAIAEINQRDTDAMLEDLFTLMELVRVKLPGDPFNVDYILIDTSPGLTTNAINGVAITDQVIMILRLVNADVDGTYHFLNTLFKSVQPKTSIIVNQIADHIINDGGREKIENLVMSQIVNAIPDLDVTFAGILLTDKEVISNEFNYAMASLDKTIKIRRPIHIISKTSQTFAEKFKSVISGVIDA
ncbi:MAG: Sporulation initiation inhibitor protein Soj [Candidatus Heimdallarchaeota archaeon LC_2]|nr:MAG: Sporulation initiation inhibitor protein Soj [Candidatus Heimdallarchaeota archaeon LC_2]